MYIYVLYVCIIWVLIKIRSRKLGYVLKIVTLIYTLYCNVSQIYKQKNKQQS